MTRYERAEQIRERVCKVGLVVGTSAIFLGILAIPTKKAEPKEYSMGAYYNEYYDLYVTDDGNAWSCDYKLPKDSNGFCTITFNDNGTPSIVEDDIIVAIK